jgi:prepilin signal peptidase PulO-like enzyme (type II secretory pathway)
VAGVSREFVIANSVLIGTQAALVALPAAGIPAPLARFSGRGWSLVLPLSIAVVVVVIATEPAFADGLTWLALIAIPPLAAAALGWAAHRGRPALALLAVPLLAVAVADTGGLAGDACAAVLTALSCVTLGRLIAGVAPAVALKAGIVAMALIDAILVFGEQLQAPNAVLNAAVPLQGLPQLQFLDLHHASMGYGDVFVAGVLGGVLAAERRPQLPVALLVLAISIAWDALFFALDTLPATVPVALALLTAELLAWTRDDRRPVGGPRRRRERARPRRAAAR